MKKPLERTEKMSNLIPDDANAGVKYRPAIENVKTKEEATAYFNACVEHSMRVHALTKEEAIKIEQSNIGYVAGYYDKETRSRVYHLYGFRHPLLPL